MIPFGHVLTFLLLVKHPQHENMALERRVALVHQALHLLAPGLANVQDIEEFPTCPHPLQTDARNSDPDVQATAPSPTA